MHGQVDLHSWPRPQHFGVTKPFGELPLGLASLCAEPVRLAHSRIHSTEGEAVATISQGSGAAKSLVLESAWPALKFQSYLQDDRGRFPILPGTRVPCWLSGGNDIIH